MSVALDPVLARVLPLVEEDILGFHQALGQATLLVARDNVRKVVETLKESEATRFDFLMDATAVDWPADAMRFEVVIHLFSSSHHHRLRIKYRVKEGQEALSLRPVYPGADWMEREIFDMYGVTFEGHGDMRRVLLYPEFEGYPLRKDYEKTHEQPLYERRYPGEREHEHLLAGGGSLPAPRAGRVGSGR